MTNLDRCLKTIAGRATDRVPAYTPTIACDVARQILDREAHTGSPSLAYASAKAWLQGEQAYDEFQDSVTEDLIDLNRALGIEVIRYGLRGGLKPTRQIGEHTFLCGDPDGVHQVWRWDPKVMNLCRTKSTAPVVQPEDWPAQVEKRTRGVEDAVAAIRETCGRWEAELQERLGDEMLVIAAAGGFSLGVDEPSLMACVLEPGAVGDLLDCQLELNIARAETLAGRGLMVQYGGGDMADKNGPLYSPSVFRELILPRLTKFIARCRELGVHHFWRTDGRLWPVTDMIFVEAGVPGYGEVDFDAGMDAATIRERYPELVIWGNISGDRLRRGSRSEVHDHCLAVLEGSGGRAYFHGCSNTVLPGTPVENVLAMMQTRDDFSPR